jgi:hypothetical protein
MSMNKQGEGSNSNLGRFRSCIIVVLIYWLNTY